MSAIPSGNDDSGAVSLQSAGCGRMCTNLAIPQHVLVLVTQLLKDGSSRLCGGGFIVLDSVHVQVILDDVGYGLSVCGGTGSAAPDGVVDLGELVGNTVGNVCTSGGSAVCAENDTVLEIDGHAEKWSIWQSRDNQDRKRDIH